MAWNTIGGTAAAAADAYGLKALASGAAPTADELNHNWRDAQRALQALFSPGVVAGGVCTASGLNVTVPSATSYYARSLWVADSAMVYAVPDSATTYLWGCSDGVVRQTNSTTPPSSFDATNACILCKATATGGTATVDLTAQQRAAYGGISRQIYDGWYQDDATASQTAVALSRDVGAMGAYAVPMRVGYLTGVRVRCSNARTAGTLTVAVYKNGSATGLAAVLDGTNPQSMVTLAAPAAYAIAAGDLLDVRVTTDGSWAAGTTPKIAAAIEIMT